MELVEIAGRRPLIEFKSFGKIPRIRDVVITEKIDGTNAAVGIIKLGPAAEGHPDLDGPAVKIIEVPEMRKMSGVIPAQKYAVYAQSRRRVISPPDDNYGFAAWVHQHAETLVDDLGPGLHFGEWWGVGINRGYGMSKRVFSLFNTYKWEVASEFFSTPDMSTVPIILRRGRFDTGHIYQALDVLATEGSLASPGYMNPEGVVAFLPASGSLYKATFDGDQPKSAEQLLEAAI